MVPFRGTKNKGGYLSCSVRSINNKQKKLYVHRFVWECYCCTLPDKMVIDHINDDRADNCLSNLQLMTQQANCKKSVKNRDYSFAANNHKNRRCVKAINQTTQKAVYFNSMHAVQQHLGINAGIVKMVCEGINNCKTGISQKDGHYYNFEFACKEGMPGDYKKSANKRPRMLTDEDRKKKQTEDFKNWAKKKYIAQGAIRL